MTAKINKKDKACFGRVKSIDFEESSIYDTANNRRIYGKKNPYIRSKKYLKRPGKPCTHSNEY